MGELEIERYLKSTQELTDWDQEIYKKLVTDKLSIKQINSIVNPDKVFCNEGSVLAIHWHPETVPVDLAEKRISKMFPDRKKELIIPTQHNILLGYHKYWGTEVDCYAPEFNRKVQLLLHFKEKKLKKADILRSMLQHTFKYRSSQFYDILDTILDPKYEERVNEAVEATATDEETVQFVRTYAGKLKMLVDENYNKTPIVSIKNKLLPNYLTQLKVFYNTRIINRSLVFVKEIKRIVKERFELGYFYSIHEIIEEVRGLGGGIVIPHPEQFWPVLLADYDVDGIEVWNPQSREYTDFLINVTIKKNRTKQYRNRPLLICMGDDTHLGEKLKDPADQNKTKASREIGYQDAWEDILVQKSLLRGNITKDLIIDSYKERLDSY